MYCKKCGNWLADTAAFCGKCGTAVLQERPWEPSLDPDPTVVLDDPTVVLADQREISGDPMIPPEMKPEKAKMGTKKLILIFTAIMVVVSLLAGYFAYSSKRIKLAYDWGTDMRTVYDDGGEKGVDIGHIIFEDKAHKIDRIEEFEIDRDEVEYFFVNGELTSIMYGFDTKDWTFEEIVEIVAGYYGNHYYPVGEYEAFWWKDGTVVRVCEWGIINYYSEERYLLGNTSESGRVIEYFTGRE